MFEEMYSKLSNSNSLGDHNNVRATKNSNDSDSSCRVFCVENLKRPEYFVRIARVRIRQS